jgi:hypothetical protein
MSNQNEAPSAPSIKELNFTKWVLIAAAAIITFLWLRKGENRKALKEVLLVTIDDEALISSVFFTNSGGQVAISWGGLLSAALSPFFAAKLLKWKEAKTQGSASEVKS